MITWLRTNTLSKTLRWLALAWSVLLVGSQTLSLDHIHLDNSSETSCVLCTHTDTTPLAAQPESAPSVVYNSVIALTEIHQPLSVAKTKYYYSRAPPAA
jgi:hypothetical protein